MSRMVPLRPLGLCGLVLALLSPARPARAEEPAVYFVGVQRDCERDGQLDHAVERRLYKKGTTTVALVRQPSGAPLPPCFGDRCAQFFRQACPATKGRILGGQVSQGKDILKVRLWLHDLQSGQTAYQDEYCQSCELVGTLATQAAKLMAAPRFGAAPGPTPQYCSQQAGTPSAPPSGPLFLTVYGDGKHKAVLLSALKQQLGLLGRRVVPVPTEYKTYPLDVLQKIVSGQKNAQVLGADVQKDGKVQMFLFDQSTSLSTDKIVECGECEKDKDILVSRVQPEAAAMLDHCFSETCGSGSATAAPPPADACEPFPDPVCGADTSSQPSEISSSARHIDPSTAKLVKGGMWGLFAASAATAVGLAIANYTDAGTSFGPNDHTVNILGPAALTATGLAVLGLAVAIPLTVHVRHAESANRHAARQADNSSKIQCPN